MNLSLISILLMASAAFAQEGSNTIDTPTPNVAKKPAIATEKQSVDDACKAEGAAAGCGTEQAGSGLVKCIETYKKVHKSDFKVSSGCNSAIKKLKADRS